MKPGRNDPCPCGSGKKYKQCCGNVAQPVGVIPAANAQASNPSVSEQNRLIALYQAGRYAELEEQAGRLLQRYPGSGVGGKILCAALMAQGKDALLALQLTVKLLPNDAEVLSNLGDALAKHERLNEAEAYFRQALKLKPQYEDALHNLGSVLVQLGKIQEAEECFQKVLAINPDCVEARYFFALNRKTTDAENLNTLLSIDRRMAEKSLALPEKDRVLLYFALGKSHENSKDFDRAFRYYTAGARLKRQAFQYDAAKASSDVDDLIRIFSAETIKRLSGHGNPSERPIFIVGMPRSGTTLTEQIIASHPDVHGAGELNDLVNITRGDIGGAAYPESLRFLDGATLKSWADKYLAALGLRSPDAKRVTDKMPENFMAIGLIHLMLPNAKIVHINRNPLDVCLSCFTIPFKNNNLPWSYDLKELAAYYKNYVRLMAHWRQVLPEGAFLDVSYESIVQDREVQARRLLAYCGLEWDSCCLESHKTERPVRTASFLQARAPVYTSSVERWRRYEKHLAPLLEVLGDLVPGR